MAKKVGIITFHRAINYGALLQGYALLEKTKECGADSCMIDYRCPFVESAYRLTWGLNDKSFKGYRTWLRGVPHLIKKKKNFRRFAKQRLNLTAKYTGLDISKFGDGLDVYITGSDQVWNMDVCGQDTNYLLNFVKDDSKKFGYAVSIGGYKMKPEETELAKKFAKISMREKSACDYVAQETGMQVHRDLDPTLLLTGEQWQKAAHPKRVIKEPYIFIYSVHPQNHMAEYAYKLSKEKGIKVYHLHNRVKMDLKEKGIQQLYDCSIEEFLALIRDAEYVVTNSFHGTVFSIMFKKQFLSELETKGGFNNRVWELLGSLGIKRRILDRVPTVNDGVTIDEKIDWEDVARRMEENRKESVAYLKSIIG